MSEKNSHLFASLAIFGVCFLILVALGCQAFKNLGYEQGVRDTQIEAARRGYGSWQVTSRGEIEFQWKEPEMRFPKSKEDQE